MIGPSQRTCAGIAASGEECAEAVAEAVADGAQAVVGAGAGELVEGRDPGGGGERDCR
jgi:hypothetical protein